MRLAPVFLSLLVAASASAQTGTGRNGAAGQGAPSGGSLFMTTRFEATVVVRPLATGTDSVEVTVLKPSYSHALLQAQVMRLGQELGSEPRGLQVYDYKFDASDPSARVVKASFGVNGLIEPSTGVLHVQPIARAFSLAQPPDQLEAIMIQFLGQVPTSNTLRSCAPGAPGCEGVQVEGRSQDAAFGVEYRVKLLAHDPEKISVPDRPQPVKPATTPAPAPKGVDWTLIALILAAAVAVGALVYSVLLRGRPRARA